MWPYTVLDLEPSKHYFQSPRAHGWSEVVRMREPLLVRDLGGV